jgi:hypothetical protein
VSDIEGINGDLVAISLQIGDRILAGHAFTSVHTIIAEPWSSSRLIVTGTGLIVFIVIYLNRAQPWLSDLKTPLFIVTFPSL